jgi:hypothetical protein
MAERDNKVAAQPWVGWGISKEEFDTYMAAKAEWDAGTPAVGSVAPDFKVQRLDTTGKRTGEMFQLSSTRGRPVALLMGSYT